jgi:hypothetical protein
VELSTVRLALDARCDFRFASNERMTAKMKGTTEDKTNFGNLDISRVFIYLFKDISNRYA